ncbi:hypothetical protein NC651_020077 [Populus alba x Populus x berolinensis]|nr:hypothetical protein NC651_020077 [Populus alba x Populus x berolinensis]
MQSTGRASPLPNYEGSSFPHRDLWHIFLRRVQAAADFSLCGLLLLSCSGFS